jgi:hypothetical protein
MPLSERLGVSSLSSGTLIMQLPSVKMITAAKAIIPNNFIVVFIKILLYGAALEAALAAASRNAF